MTLTSATTKPVLATHLVFLLLYGQAVVSIGQPTSLPSTRPASDSVVKFAGMRAEGRSAIFAINVPYVLGGSNPVDIALRKAVDELKPTQSFSIILFHSGRNVALTEKSLLIATPSNKRKAFEFLDRKFLRGEAKWQEAIEYVFQQKPEQVFLIAEVREGDQENESLVSFCAKETRGGKPKINTIAYVRKEASGPEDWGLTKTLKAIAKASGGQFRVATEDDLDGDK